MSFMAASSSRRAEPLLVGYCVVLVGLTIEPILAGPASNIDSDYWQWSVPCAVVGAGLLGWLFQQILVGRKFWPRGSSADQTIDEAWSWLVGILAASTLMMIAPLDAVYAINETVGVPYTELYTVT
jgi:hypothetical protein